MDGSTKRFGTPTQIRSSGWLIDFIVTAPDSQLLSWSWITLAANIPDLNPYFYSAGIPISLTATTLFSIASGLNARPEKTDHGEEEQQKMKALNLEEAVIHEATAAHEKEEEAWTEMVKAHTLPDRAEPGNRVPVYIRTFVMGAITGLFPFLMYNSLASADGFPRFEAALTLTLFLTGFIRGKATDTSALTGGFRLALTGVLICLLIHMLIRVTS